MTKNLDPAAASVIRSEIERSRPCCFFLDYDGTLCPFVDDPENAVLTKDVSELLGRLASDPSSAVFIVSGRSVDFLERTFRYLPVSLIAEHGAAVRLQGTAWMRKQAPNGWKDEVRSMLAELVRDNPLSFIEEKEYSICWHFRKMETNEGLKKVEDLVRMCSQRDSLSLLHIVRGNRIVEFGSGMWNKGIACADAIAIRNYKSIVAIGDDVTDEDMFTALPPGAITIKVGEGGTTARFRVADPSSVLSFIGSINVDFAPQSST